MFFLHTEFLWGLLSLLIPIIIHFFNLKRPKKVFFSNVRFLKFVEEKSSKKIQLKHWLVLITRCLALLFLILIFAKPFIKNDNQSQAKTSNYSFYLDNSQSMSAVFSNGLTNFELAKAELQKLISGLPSSAKIQILTNDNSPKSNMFLTQKNALDYLNEIALSNNSKSYIEILEKQNSFDAENVKAIWISDFQKSQFKISGTFDSTNLSVINLTSSEKSNIYIDTVFLDEAFLQKNVNFDLKLMVRNSGNLPANTVITAKENGKQIGVQSVDLEALEQKELVFTLLFDTDGDKQITILLEDNEVLFDNDKYLTLTVGQKVSVYEIYESKSDFERLYKNEESFNFTSSNANSVEYSALSSADIIILNKLKSTSEGLIFELNQLKEKGKTLVVIPTKENLTVLNQLGIQFQVISDTSRVELVVPDANQPFFKGVFSKYDAKALMPQTRALLDFKGYNSTILKDKLGRNFLVEYKNQGFVYAFSNPVNAEEANSIFRHSIVVPLFYKLAMSSLYKQKTFYSIGDELVLNNAYEDVFLLQNDLKIYPEVFSSQNTMLKLREEGLKQGFYTVNAKDSVVSVLGLNNPKSESLFDFYTTEELNKMNLKVIEQKGDINFSTLFSEQNFGVHLWKYCVWLALLFFLIEIALIRFLK